MNIDPSLSRQRCVTWLTLFASTGTLICCALPILFVTLGLGATVAALTRARAGSDACPDASRSAQNNEHYAEPWSRVRTVATHEPLPKGALPWLNHRRKASGITTSCGGSC